MTIFKFGELFCGPGGLAYGALHAQSNDGEYKLVHEWANDNDFNTCETYKQNISPINVYCNDVRDLSIEKLGEIDAFAYGFPCNSFSQVGEHQGLDNKKFGQLYWFGVKVLQTYQPKFFIAENVSGIRSAGFNVILKDLADCGYVVTPHLYKAEEYGIPQTRHRVIIVGIRKDLNIKYKIPKPITNVDISSRTALSNIPATATNNIIRKVSEKVKERLSYINPGENIWQAEEAGRLPEHLRIKTKTKISQIYRKLDPEKPAYTVTAAGGGGTFMYHWTNRELTNRERARLQTFPDDFDFWGNYMSVRKQIGMAVPPKLAEIVTTAILNCFAGIDYPSVKPNLKI